MAAYRFYIISLIDGATFGSNNVEDAVAVADDEDYRVLDTWWAQMILPNKQTKVVDELK